jgi:hypothetical protein
VCKGRDSGNTWRLSVEMEKASILLREEAVGVGGEGRKGERLEGKGGRGREERRRLWASMGVEWVADSLRMCREIAQVENLKWRNSWRG